MGCNLSWPCCSPWIWRDMQQADSCTLLMHFKILQNSANVNIAGLSIELEGSTRIIWNFCIVQKYQFLNLCLELVTVHSRLNKQNINPGNINIMIGYFDCLGFFLNDQVNSTAVLLDQIVSLNQSQCLWQDKQSDMFLFTFW